MMGNILFYVVFLCQIVLISYYLPARVSRRIQFVLKTYPPSTYPKLYPRGAGYYHSFRRYFRIANTLLLPVGLSLTFACWYWGYPARGKLECWCQ